MPLRLGTALRLLPLPRSAMLALTAPGHPRGLTTKQWLPQHGSRHRAPLDCLSSVGRILPAGYALLPAHGVVPMTMRLHAGLASSHRHATQSCQENKAAIPQATLQHTSQPEPPAVSLIVDVPAPSQQPSAPAGGPAAETPSPAVAAAGAAAAAGVGPAAARAPRRGPMKPEVLAPAGGWPQLKAAVECGADAVYFGLSDFNARARASNFTPEELPAVMEYLHDRGVKGFVTLNILVFDEELPAAEERVRQIAEAGVDAVIVQDLGLTALIRRVAPGLPVHGSTQMSITSPEGADFAARMGVERVVVGRELSIREISQVQRGTSAEVEAFVHGALCVSYSGQCFSSEAWGGRSANRGQCAQACRMPYGLIVDGQVKDMQDIKYLLSPQDLAAVEHVPQLIAAGVSCFKIEGRLKGPEYVAITTKAYRTAVDAAWNTMYGSDAISSATNSGSSRSSAGSPTAAPSPPRTEAAKQAVALSDEDRLALHQVFSRGQDADHPGLTPGFLEGPQHQRLVRGRAPRHRGVYVGRVSGVTSQGVVLALEAPLKRGDGVVFDAGEPEEREQGGAIFDLLDRRGRSMPGEVAPAAQGGAATSGSSREVLLMFGAGQVALHRVKPGQLVWRTKDSALDARIRSTYEGLAASRLRKVPVDVAVRGQAGEPLTIVLRDDSGHEASASTRVALSPATSRPMTHADLARAIGQLGDNTLDTRSLDTSGLTLGKGLSGAAGLFMPLGEIKAARRAAAEALVAARRQHDYAAGLSEQPVLPVLLQEARRRLPLAQPAAAACAHPAAGAGSSTAASGGEGGSSTTGGSKAAPSSASASGSTSGSDSGSGATLRVLCRTPDQVSAALSVPWLHEVVLDFLEVHGLKEAVAAVRAAGKRVVVATPRVLKPDEERLWHFFLRLRADALLVRSTGFLHQMVCLGGPGATVRALDLPIPALEGDFSLNAANALTADLLLGLGLQRLAPTHDLNAAQICGLARALPPRAPQLEVILHHHLPVFHTEHCVFARFLSSGNSYKDCGKPCESHGVHLRDGSGADHRVLADMGCRNTVFNAGAQSGLFYLPDFLRAGLSQFRLELVDEPAHVVAPLLEGYRDVLHGARSPSDLWTWLGSLPDANGRAHGVAAGSLEVRQERRRGSLRPTAAAVRAAGAASRA